MDLKHKMEYDMPSKVIDLDGTESLIRALYNPKMLMDPRREIDQDLLDVSFFDNSAIDIQEFKRNIHFGQKLYYTVKEMPNFLEASEVKQLEFKEGIKCGGQLDLDCEIPCGGVRPTYRNGELALDREYGASASHCAKTDMFLPDPTETFMSAFDFSFRSAKMRYVLDVWNKLVEKGVASTVEIVDPILKVAADGKTATHFWDFSDETDANKYIKMLNHAYQYMTHNYKGNFQVFATTHFANSLVEAVASLGLHPGLGLSMEWIRLGDVYRGGMKRFTATPAQLSNVPINILPDHQDYVQKGVNLHPLYTNDSSAQYVVIASSDAIAHMSVGDFTYRSNGSCQAGAIETISRVFWGGSDTIFPEKVLIIKLPIPAISFELEPFCC